MKTTAALAFSLLLALGLTGCGANEPAATPTPSGPPTSPPIAAGTLKGKLAMVGGPAPGTSVAAPGHVTITSSTGTTVTADTDAQGRFEILLAPGKYRVTATSPKYNSGKGTCSTEPALTTLVAEKTADVSILCQLR